MVGIRRGENSSKDVDGQDQATVDRRKLLFPTDRATFEKTYGFGFNAEFKLDGDCYPAKSDTGEGYRDSSAYFYEKG